MFISHTKGERRRVVVYSLWRPILAVIAESPLPLSLSPDKQANVRMVAKRCFSGSRSAAQKALVTSRRPVDERRRLVTWLSAMAVTLMGPTALYTRRPSIASNTSNCHRHGKVGRP